MSTKYKVKSSGFVLKPFHCFWSQHATEEKYARVFFCSTGGKKILQNATETTQLEKDKIKLPYIHEGTFFETVWVEKYEDDKFSQFLNVYELVNLLM